ncbi:hypothetical protein DYH10_00695 [Candidatus Saccharibacteria bacterium CPR2]|nr:hypothetical protein [Candidatus Saccharibacteria bacterium CPR2]
MQLTQNQIRKFQSIYKEHFSIDLSDEEAIEKGSQLVKILRKVYKPIPKNEDENNNEPAIT